MTDLKKPVSRVSQSPLCGDFYGPDRGRRIVVTLIPGNGTNEVPDLLELRPHGTRRPERVALCDVYQWILKCRCNKSRMEKLREIKAAKAERRARAKFKRGLIRQ